MKVFKNLLAILIISLCFCPKVNAANLITNGSFEQGNWNGNWSWDRLSPGSADLTGWQIGGYGIDWHNSAEMKNPQNGNFVVDLKLNAGGDTQNGSISQIINTTPGEKYNLSFYLANPYGYNEIYPILSVNAVGIDFQFAQTPSSNQNLLWGYKSVDFFALNDQTTITFSTTSNCTGYWGPVLDNISLTACPVTPVPEPSSFILGLMGILNIIRLKKKA